MGSALRAWAWLSLVLVGWTGVAWGEAAALRLGDGREVALAGVKVLQPEGPAVAGGLALTDPTATSIDRLGRMRAQVATGDGTWLQGALVREGRAVVVPAADLAPDVLAALLRLEQAARAAKLGIWADGRLGPWPAQEVAARQGDYVLVRGRVREASRRQEFLYLNFGADWRRDFTVRAETGELRRLAAAGLDLAGLAGRNILVRGYLFDAAGPMIEVTHPAQIEVEP